jgi:formylmethanofuran--tetrahydromethanopterin N-formyltransferase
LRQCSPSEQAAQAWPKLPFLRERLTVTPHVEIEDTFAEAFPMRATRLIITAETPDWARRAAQAATGCGTSIVGCDAEAGIERDNWPPEETPDARPGISILLFAFSREGLEKAAAKRIGQCVLTCPSSACYDGLPSAEERIRLGSILRFFGDGFQSCKGLQGKRYWRIPVMDGEFVCEETAGSVSGVAGGNLLILGEDQAQALAAASTAARAAAACPDVILPFPGGVCRSGSKIGSRHAGLRASTNEAFCPTLRGLTRSALPPNVNAAYEIVIDGLSQVAVERAMAAAIVAAQMPGIVRISAGNFEGKLGKYMIPILPLAATGQSAGKS